MLFSSLSFVYFFLPVVFAVYFAAPRRAKNAVLLLSSLVFYFYGEASYVLLLLFSSVIDFIAGQLIDRHRGTKKAKAALLFSIAANLLILGFFKYSDFFIANINAAFGTAIPLLHIPLPIGISFFTFQTMSYTIDVYRGGAQVQKNPFAFATYVSMFPQLVAGPIVRYRTVAEELTSRRHSIPEFAAGAGRFVVGLGKKVLIANLLGELNAVAAAPDEPSVLFCWLLVISFSLQVYFDFSAYSDMAIGLGRIFGFHFLENFNYPFISKSVSEFWRRWHISLGTWFREYLYIPLGGNRVSRLKWVRNIFIVWFCTGFWHGASWNFVLWGLYFGVVLAIEKLFLDKLLARWPALLRHAYTLFVVLISFVIFHVDSLAGIGAQLRGMFFAGGLPAVSRQSLYYLKSYGPLLLVSLVGATPLLRDLARRADAGAIAAKVKAALEPCFYIALLTVVTGYLIDSSFNPFLYFRF